MLLVDLHSSVGQGLTIKPIRTMINHHNLSAEQTAHIRAHVHQAALAVLGPVTDPQTAHQAQFSMGFVLALIALYRQAEVGAFTQDPGGAA